MVTLLETGGIDSIASMLSSGVAESRCRVPKMLVGSVVIEWACEPIFVRPANPKRDGTHVDGREEAFYINHEGNTTSQLIAA